MVDIGLWGLKFTINPRKNSHGSPLSFRLNVLELHLIYRTISLNFAKNWSCFEYLNIFTPVSHNRNEIELIWSGITGDDNAVEEFLMERSRKSTSVQIKDSRRKLRINSKISYDAPGIINNSPMIKRFETSRCSGEEWKGIYNRVTN